MAHAGWLYTSWKPAIGLLVGMLLGGCSGAEAEQSEPAGSVRGKLAVYVASFDDGRREVQRYLRVNGSEDEERLLDFGKPVDIPAGVEVRVWGHEDGSVFRVERYELVGSAGGSLGSASSELINAPANPSRSFAFVLVDIGGGINLTADEARRRLLGMNAGDGSLRQYFLETSYQVQDINGDVFGPLRYPMTTCDTRNMATTLRSQVPGTFDHYLWYFGSRTSACSWSGLAESGEPATPANDTWYNGRSSCVVLVQEPGHNLGMRHSSYLNCGGVPFHDAPTGNCQHEEYGDPYCPMGGGCRHMNAWHKVYEGWLQGCNSVRVNSSGTFTLLPLETACNGTQVLQIPMPKVRTFERPADGGGSGGTSTISYYYLELRTASGFDATMAGVPTVLVHVAEGYRTATQSGRHTWLLDMDRSTTRKDGLVAGQSYSDPAGGVSFTVQALSSSSATISVQIAGGTGPATCLDGTTTLEPPGPASCGAGGTGGTGGTGGGDTGGVGGTGGGGTGGDGTGGIGSSSGGSGGSPGGAGGTTGGAGGTDIGTGGTSGGAGGSGGNFGSPGCTGGSSCDTCDGCYALCLCSTSAGNPATCAAACAPSSGTGGSGATGTAGTAGSAPARPGPALAEDSGGCACSTPRPASPKSSLWLFALGALWLLRLRGRVGACEAESR